MRFFFDRVAAPLLLVLMVLALLVGSNAAQAMPPGWIGSGGESFGYAKNPWFVRNTTSVNYCVEIDAASISASPATIREAIQSSIGYWKRELRQQNVVGSGPDMFAEIATQDFSEITDCAKASLRFVFGYGKLTPEEVKALEEPRRYIGIAIRKTYDLAQLRGSGFIYLSSDVGPHAYNTLPATEPLTDRAWKEPKLLQYVLLHEMGHVFGIPHTGSGLMSEVFLDQLLHKNFSQFYIDHPVESFLNPPLNFDICTFNGSFDPNFFQIASGSACLHVTGVSEDGTLTWQLATKASAKATPDPVFGTVKASRLLDIVTGAAPAIIVQLPPEQKVFTFQERMANSFILGPVFGDGAAKGIFKTTTSARPFEVQVDLRADSLVITGIVNGKLKQVLVYRAPSLLNGILPVGQ